MQDTYHERKNIKGLVGGPLLVGGLGPGPPALPLIPTHFFNQSIFLQGSKPVKTAKTKILLGFGTDFCVYLLAYLPIYSGLYSAEIRDLGALLQ